MNEILTSLGRWDLDLHQVRAHMYGAPTPANANAGTPSGY
jgi:hypothetical protein